MRCGKCHGEHTSVAGVRACHQGLDVVPCTWLVERWYPVVYFPDGDSYDPCEEGPIVEECGADAIFRADDSGWDCVAGHEHTDAQARWEQGWDYAEDDGEARRLAANGVEPRDLVTAGPYRGGAT